MRRLCLWGCVALLARFASAEGALQVEVAGSTLSFRAPAPNGGIRVRVGGPDGFALERSFGPGESAVVDLGRDGPPRDGTYHYEATVRPQETRQRGADDATSPRPGFRESGFVVVRDGRTSPGVPGADAAGPSTPPASEGPRREASPAPDDFVVADDLIVQGRACVGSNCVNGESMDGVLNVKGVSPNGPSILFDYNGARVWKLIAYDDSFYLFKVATDVPFFITSEARTGSLFVDQAGVGIGTGVPLKRIHAYDADTPTLRLEQGDTLFTPQIWDLSGNEARFFVRDSTSGFVPLSILTGSGNLGLGTANPVSPMHVYRNNGTARLTVEDASFATAERTLMRLKNNGKVRFALENTATATTWTFDNSFVGFTVSDVGDGVNELVLDTAGNLSITGLLSQGSDRDSKQDITPVDPDALLERVAALPLSTWSYKTESARHVGPMAQDFAAAFGLGNDDKRLAPSDLAGVSLAAVQALKARLDEREARVRDLEQRFLALERALGGVRPSN